MLRTVAVDVKVETAENRSENKTCSLSQRWQAPELQIGTQQCLTLTDMIYHQGHITEEDEGNGPVNITASSYDIPSVKM
jgi:hypothetical protein